MSQPPRGAPTPDDPNPLIELTIHELHQATGAFEHIVSLQAVLLLTPGDPTVSVTVESHRPDDADPAMVQIAADAVAEGFRLALADTGAGALATLHRVAIHPVDFIPRYFRQYAQRELAQALENIAQTPENK